MKMPMKPGYYWAKWRIASDETHEGDELTPSKTWEIVQVNINVVDWDDDPSEPEALSVAVPGVRETQWRDCFVWGAFVAELGAQSKPARFTDGDRLAFLTEQARKSRTGISFDWVPSVEGEPSGWRFMRLHFIGEPGSDIRSAIDGAMLAIHGIDHEPSAKRAQP